MDHVDGTGVGALVESIGVYHSPSARLSAMLFAVPIAGALAMAGTECSP